MMTYHSRYLVVLARIRRQCLIVCVVEGLVLLGILIAAVW